MREIRSETGVTLVLVALCLVILVGFLALAIDTGRLNASHAQQTHTAEYIALASLERFRDRLNANPSDQAGALAAALARATELGGMNFLVGKPKDSGLQTAPGDLALGDPAAVAERRAGILTPGRWWFDPPDCSTVVNHPCPCVGGVRRPCFEVTNTDINAFRVRLRTKEDSPVRSVFAQVIGTPESHLVSSATAALLPRHGMFLVDLSASTEGETHLKSGPRAAAYAYRLRGYDFPDPDGICTGSVKCTCNLTGIGPEPAACLHVQAPRSNDPAESVNNPALRCGFFLPEDEVYNGVYVASSGGASLLNQEAALERLRGMVNPETENTRHFRDDYACYTITYHEQPLGAGAPVTKTEHYIIDTRVAPEPLNSIIEGISVALNQFEGRAVSGDRAGAIGFDISTNILERRFELSPPGSVRFETLKRLKDNREEQIRRMFFPRTIAETVPPFEAFTANTDILSALQDALSQLSQPELGTADKFIVLFTDGLSNCYGGVCNAAALNTFASSIQEIYAFSEYSLRDKNVALHTFLFGDSVGPHTLLAKKTDGTGGCYSEDELRQLRRVITNPFHSCSTTPWDTDLRRVPEICRQSYETLYRDAVASGPSRFLFPNVFGGFSSMTGGVWAPIRPNCAVDGAGNPIDVTGQIEEACRTAPSRWTGVSDGVWVDNELPVNSPEIPVVLPPYTDGAGRLLCEPTAQTKREQIERYVNRIMGQNPYVLVE